MSGEELLKSAQRRLVDAAAPLKTGAGVAEILRLPKETLAARLVITMDEGSRRAFPAWRCRYDDSLGPTKGGIRFHPSVCQAEVESLALWMTVKCAITGLPYGGAKGGVAVDPDVLSAAELERLSRAYVRAFLTIIGPDRDIPAPDVGTDAKVMGWMADEYGKAVGHPEPAVVTGKPVAEGGSKGRETATAMGGFLLLAHYFNRLGLRTGSRVAVQGLGAVGMHMAHFLSEAGYRVVSVSDSSASLLCKEGLDTDAVEAAKQARRPIAALADGKRIVTGPPDAALAADCEILIPAALENAITEANVDAVKAGLIVEMANGPTTPAAEAKLLKRSAVILPDVLANSGGVIVSYFEWLQNRQSENWSIEQVHTRLDETMRKAADAVWATAQTQKLTLREAAYAYGVSRIVTGLDRQVNGDHFATAEKSTLPAG